MCFFFQAEDGIRDLVRSRGLGDVYKRQVVLLAHGSPDPRHRADVDVLAEAVASRTGAPVVAAYLDHHGPTPADAAHSMGAAWVVPLLLSDGFHRRVDVPAALAQMRGVAGGSFDLVAPALALIHISEPTRPY